MAARARLIDATVSEADCRRVSAPTLVITGEAALDHVVPVAGTVGYAQCIAGARAITLERTGHLGSVTRPHAFARAIGEFLAGASVAPPVSTLRAESRELSAPSSDEHAA
jgi:pimeloyl-ACP methyl ester carboxylesterase